MLTSDNFNFRNNDKIPAPTTISFNHHQRQPPPTTSSNSAGFSESKLLGTAGANRMSFYKPDALLVAMQPTASDKDVLHSYTRKQSRKNAIDTNLVLYCQSMLP